MLATLGDGNYDVGSRARDIRDRLREREQFTARDMLDIQLDARSTFLSRWRDLILRHLTPDTVAGDAARARVPRRSSRRTGPARRRPIRPPTG